MSTTSKYSKRFHSPEAKQEFLRKRREKYNSVSEEEKKLRKEKRHIQEQIKMSSWSPEKLEAYKKKNNDGWKKWEATLPLEKRQQFYNYIITANLKRYHKLSPEKKAIRLESMKRYAKMSNAKRKEKIISHYSHGSMRCMNPNCEVPGGATNLLCLTVDHINGGGKKQERELKKQGTNFYAWLIKNNFPPEMEKELQILCNNCQAIKRVENKEGCKHKKLN
jgi:hypothetical protein